MQVSCGTQKRRPSAVRKQRQDATTHGNTVGAKGRPAYRSWLAMKDRCLNIRANNYAWYGGRVEFPVTVGERWLHSFENFSIDMGPRPLGTTLHRVNGFLGYWPHNCMWASPDEQALEVKQRRQIVKAIQEVWPPMQQELIEQLKKEDDNGSNKEQHVRKSPA